MDWTPIIVALVVGVPAIIGAVVVAVNSAATRREAREAKAAAWATEAKAEAAREAAVLGHASVNSKMDMLLKIARDLALREGFDAGVKQEKADAKARAGAAEKK